MLRDLRVDIYITDIIVINKTIGIDTYIICIYAKRHKSRQKHIRIITVINYSCFGLRERNVAIKTLKNKFFNVQILQLVKRGNCIL